MHNQDMGGTRLSTGIQSTIDLESTLAQLNKDYSGLNARICTIDQSIKCDCDGVTLRLHFPAFRQRKATVSELVDSIVHYLVAFSLHRTEIKHVTALKSKIPDDQLIVEISKLRTIAVDLFKRAQKTTKRNGEAGELLLYLMTEWILEAPQLLAKMSLKTNRQMPIHGSDGIHVKYSSSTSSLHLYWGESKIHSNVSNAITDAVKSIVKSLKDENIKQELSLVSRYIDFVDLDEEAKANILRYFDPFDPLSNKRLNITTCLIGFDFDGFTKVLPTSAGADPEAEFKKLATEKLTSLSSQISKKLKDAKISDHTIEMFFFPVPSVSDLRDLFQTHIGWNK